MALFQERLRTTKDIVTDRASDVATAGAVSDLSVSATSFRRLTAVTSLDTIVADTGGKEVTLINANTVSATILNESGTTAANRIVTGTGGNVAWPAGAGVTFKYDDAASRWRITSIVSAGGDVTGPAASVDSEIALFSSTSGKVIKRATGTGYVKIASGVLQTPVATVPANDVLGRTDSGLPTAGRIGEEFRIARTTIYASGAATANTYYDVTSLSVTLTAGLWDISVMSASQVEQGAIGIAAIITALRNGSTVLQETISDPGFVGASPSYCHSFITQTSIAVSTTYKVSLKYINSSGTPTVSNLYSRGDLITGGSYIRAVRVG